MRLLLDEMYPPALVTFLGESGIDAVTVADLGLAGAPDPAVFAAAQKADRALLTENVADFVQLAADAAARADRNAGLLIALSSRFSRRPSGTKPLAAAIHAIAGEDLVDRVVYLAAADTP